MHALSIRHPPVPGSDVPSIMHPLWAGSVVCLPRFLWACFAVVLLLPLGVFLVEPAKTCFLKVPIVEYPINGIIRRYDLASVDYTAIRLQRKMPFPNISVSVLFFFSSLWFPDEANETFLLEDFAHKNVLGKASQIPV